MKEELSLKRKVDDMATATLFMFENGGQCMEIDYDRIRRACQSNIRVRDAYIRYYENRTDVFEAMGKPKVELRYFSR